MKLSAWAKEQGVSYKTAWRLWKAGRLDAYALPTGTVIVRSPRGTGLTGKVAIYSRVSSSENKNNLERQAERLQQYAVARGYQIYKVVKEVGSGVNDERKLLSKLLSDKNYDVLIVEHKDRLTRFGFHYLDNWFESQGRKIEVVNFTVDGQEDLMQDLVAIITSFCARLYGLRGSRRKTEKIIAELKSDAKGA